MYSTGLRSISPRMVKTLENWGNTGQQVSSKNQHLSLRHYRLQLLLPSQHLAAPGYQENIGEIE